MRTSLGEVYDPLGAHLHDPYPFFARARQEEPVFFSPAVNAWVVTRHDHVRAVLRNPALYSSRNALPQIYPVTPAARAVLAEGFPPGGGVVQLDEPGHLPVRKALVTAMTETTRGWEPWIRATATRLLDRVLPEGRADLMAAYAHALSLEITCRLLGWDAAHHTVAKDGFEGILTLFGTPQDEDGQAVAARRIVAAQQLAGEYVRARRREPREDLTSRMVAALAPGTAPLTFEQQTELVGLVVELILAGQVNTGPAIGSTVRYLIAGGHWVRLRERPTLIPNALEETLRYDSPSAGLYREVTQDTDLGGATLVKGAKVAMKFNSANRGLGVRPDTYDPTRKPVAHLSFGYGIHHCVGAQLARQVGRISLEVLTQRLPGPQLDPDQPIRMRPVHDLRSPNALHVVW